MNYEALEKLVALKEKGILSEEEFQTEKKKLLNSTNEVSQNTTTQEETTSQIVEQNNYNANPILQEHKTKGSPEKTVLLVILIPIVIIGIMWFLDKKDSTPSYNYTPSSNYTSTTSPTTSTSSSNNSTTTTNTNTTNTSKYTSNSSIQNTSSTTSVNTNNKTSSITKNPEDLTNEEVAEILWGKEYTEFGKDIIGPTLFYFDKSLNPKEE